MPRSRGRASRSTKEKLAIALDTLGWLIVVIGLAGPSYLPGLTVSEGWTIVGAGFVAVAVGLYFAIAEA